MGNPEKAWNSANLSFDHESISNKPTPYCFHSSRFSVFLPVYFSPHVSKINRCPPIFVILSIWSRSAQENWKMLPFKWKKPGFCNTILNNLTPLSLLTTWRPNTRGMTCARTKTSKVPTQVRLLLNTYTVVKTAWKWRGPAKLHFQLRLGHRPRPEQEVNPEVFTSC